MGEFQTISAITGRPIEPARARTSHPQTSHDAAGRVDVTKREGEVLRAIRLRERRGQIGATEVDVRHELLKVGIVPSESGPRSRMAALTRSDFLKVVRHADGLAVYVTTPKGYAKAVELARAAAAEKGRIAA